VSARDSILSAIRSAAVPPAPAAPALPVRAAPADTGALRDEFLRILAEVGGRGAVRRPEQSALQLVAEMFGADRAGTVVVRGRFAVAENGAVYVDAADLETRNSIVLAEHLVIIVPASAIVPTMHEAMRLMPADSRCGWFLSGPSKTADIEQSLVVGAQGSRTHTVIF